MLRYCQALGSAILKHTRYARRERIRGMATRLKVKEFAQARGLSQRKLFFKSEVDNKTISRIFNDPYAIVTTETLDKLARALNVDVSLLVESDPPLPKSLD